MIDYLVIGHICADRQPDGSTRLGGTGLFSSLTAHRLGLRTAVITACADDFDLSMLPSDLLVVRQSSPVTTVFENRYLETGRVQTVHARARSIELGTGAAGAGAGGAGAAGARAGAAGAAGALPAGWEKAAIVHLAPIIQEVPKDGCKLFEGALVGATPQGWLRTIHPSKSVTTDPKTLLELPWVGREIVVLSEEDVQHDEPLVRKLAAMLPLVVFTRAERGATVFVSGRPTDVPAYPAHVVDPTGAGDVFAAAFFAALKQDGDPIHAARWACAAASCSLEGFGIEALPTPDDVRRRMGS
ncbi:PfkB family carbohydrate kinase [Pendulispora albinea]|uniref:PfkB family carbohydrate kinase n=1 Tax=Pendulispora albinea TaxID=2741071 RepID=A0ABZ2M640_9BACT